MTDNPGDEGTAEAGATPDGGGPVDATAAIDTGEPESPDRSDGSVPKAIAVGAGLGVLGIAVMVLISGLVGMFSGLIGGLSLGVLLVVTLVVGQYVGFFGVALGYLRWRGFDRTGIVEYLGVRRPTLRELGIAFGGALVMFAIAVVASVVIQSIGAETATNDGATVAMQNPGIIPLIIVAMFLVVGPCEELLYRGIVQNRLRESLSPVPAILIATVVFATVHVVALSGGGASGVLLGIGILLFPGVMLGAVYEYTGNLVVPVLMHGTYNSILFTLIYIAVAYGPELSEAGAAVLPL